MPLIRPIAPALMMSAFCSCATGLLPPVADAWFSQGPESQIVLERRLHLEVLDGGAALRTDLFEMRLLRQAATITMRIPTGPNQRIEAISADWRRLDGAVTELGAEDFIAVDRLDRPVGRNDQPAAYVRRLSLPAQTLVRWRAIRHQHRPELFPYLELHGPFPIRHAELRVSGPGFDQLELKTRALPSGTLPGAGQLVAVWRNLQPSVAHPYRPGELGRRSAWLSWKKTRFPGLVARMLKKTNTDFQLRTLPSVGGDASAQPCLLRPWGSERLRPETAVLATASRLNEGGYELHVPEAFRRPFRDCTLIQPGLPARLTVKQEAGARVLRLRTSIDSQGRLVGKGQLIYSGAGARQVRQGSVAMTAELQRLLQPLAAGLSMGKAKVSGTGPVHLAFTLRVKVTTLDPSRWLNSPLASLSYLGPGTVLGPAIQKRMVEWVFDWPTSSKLPPPTGVASVGSGPLSASVTWSLGPQRTLRFVRSLNWEPRPMAVQPDRLLKRLDQLRITALPLPTP